MPYLRPANSVKSHNKENRKKHDDKATVRFKLAHVKVIEEKLMLNSITKNI